MALSQHLDLPLELSFEICSYLEEQDLFNAVQIKPLHTAALWTLYSQDTRGDELNESRALTWGAFYGKGNAVEWAIHRGASVERSRPFHGRDIFIEGDNPLNIAASQGHVNIIQILLDNGAEVNSWTHHDPPAMSSQSRLWKTGRSFSPLFSAILYGQESVARFLIQKGASLVIEDPDKSLPCDPSNQERVNVLHLAAECGMLELVRFLVEEHGVPIDSRDSFQRVPLVFAMSTSSDMENKDVIKYLVDRGSSLDFVDSVGYNLMHRAVLIPDGDKADGILQILLRAGVEVNTTGAHDGPTPLHLAVWKRNRALIATLVDAGARVDMISLEDLLLRYTRPKEPRNLEAQARSIGCLYSLLRRQVPDDMEHLLLRLLETNYGQAAEVLYRFGVDLPDMSPRGLVALIHNLLDPEWVECGNTSLAFMIRNLGHLICRLDPEVLLAKLLAGPYVNSPDIVGLMQQDINLDWRDEEGRTLLHILASNEKYRPRECDDPVLNGLLDRGIDVNAKCKGGMTALHLLVVNSMSDWYTDSEDNFGHAVDDLVMNGLDINAVDASGQTALHHLARSPKANLLAYRIKELILRGIDVPLRNNDSKRAFDVFLEQRKSMVEQRVKPFAIEIFSAMPCPLSEHVKPPWCIEDSELESFNWGWGE
ncbi:Ankyrin repeat-containing domain [Fusarium albosuccineum]|uniref:Ankyrin repeat-containing domain n=1 Tax=Fusarium albosuccineum TaxID=1237068 RepID=A0A8H4PF17_9HYPO|nr:Ankyrin repeat-containing domain [Fusarium albosuccineum]